MENLVYSEVEIQDFFDDLFNDDNVKNLEGSDLNEAQVNYYIRRVKKNKNAMKMVEERRKAIQRDYESRLKLWEAKNKDRLQEDIDYCLEKLNAYFDAHSNNDSQKLVFPEGRIGFYKKPMTISVNKDEALASIQELIKAGNNDLQKFIIKVDSLDSDSLKKAGTVDEQFDLFKINDVAISGVKVNPASVDFNVR